MQPNAYHYQQKDRIPSQESHADCDPVEIKDVWVSLHRDPNRSNVNGRSAASTPIPLAREQETIQIEHEEVD